jgi:ATP-dependent DNA helicase Rep
VQLMTLHAAKGLEFPHVYIAGMEENLLPHRNCIDGDAVIEERRLAYVGITRAQRTLAFTIARKRKQYGDVISTVPSRFLAELPPDDLEHEGGGFEKKPEQLEKTANATLSGLRAMFE